MKIIKTKFDPFYELLHTAGRSWQRLCVYAQKKVQSIRHSRRLKLPSPPAGASKAAELLRFHVWCIKTQRWTMLWAIERWEFLLLLADIYLTLLRLTVERWNEKWWCDMRNKKQHYIHKNWVCPALYAGDSTTLMSNCSSGNQDVKESRVLKVNCLLLKK